jgi:hypothetical protein
MMERREGSNEVVAAAIHIALGAIIVAVGRSAGVAFTLEGAWQLILLVVLLGLLWVSLAKSLARNERRFAASTAALLLLVSVAAVALPAQYVIQRLNRLRPWNDELLVRADLAMGVDLRAMIRWTTAQPTLWLALEMAYRTFITQTFVPIVCAYAGLIPTATVRTYMWQFVVCLWITLLTLWAIPVASPHVWLSYEMPLHVTSAMTGHLESLRGAGAVTFRFSELEGIVALPSFHTMGALAVTVACWRVPILGPVLVGTNALLIASTVLLGIHYSIDVIAGILIYAAVAVAFRFIRFKRG